MKSIFFLIIFVLVGFSFVTIQQVYANHITGQDDVFYWREFDVDNTRSVWCTFDDITPINDRISLQCEGGTFNGTVRTGALFIMKTFNKADLRSGALTNTITVDIDQTCSEATCPEMKLVLMDGAYTYNSLTEPGGFPANINYQRTTNAASLRCLSGFGNWDTTTGSGAQEQGFCLGANNADFDNIFGAGDLGSAGIDSSFGTAGTGTATKGNFALSVAITNALWNESTESQVTLFILTNKQDTTGVGLQATNHYVSIKSLVIDNTPVGTMRWDFPITAGEATNWNNYVGYLYEQNGTESDHGYFFSYEPSVPDPPTNLVAIADVSDIDLAWDAPVFVGFDPLVGYKVERESPIGGGFAVIVANTGNTNEFYSDSTITPGQEYNYRVSALNSIGSSIPSNESKDGSPPASVPDLTPTYSCPSTTSAFELFIKAITSSSVGLCWDSYANPENIVGYQVNYTTPFGDPLTVVINNTGTNATRTYLVTSLQPSTPYSFQIQAWPKTLANQTNIANATTLNAEFNVGEFSVNAGTNPYRIDWEFHKTILNSTQTQLDVDFTNTLDPSCNMEYNFAQTNDTYSNLTSSAIDDNKNRTSFIFNNVQNEIIKVTCYDDNNTVNRAVYIITQESFPLIEQIANFRNGTYGTTGQFGAFDLVTLLAIILSMIGFNRINAGAGAIFTVITIGALATLNIITWPTIILSGIALVVLLAIITHSRDDVSE
jgi:hypothetical protein